MMRNEDFASRIGGAALVAAVIAGIARLSSVPIVAHPSADAVLRLAWSARPERIENCRQRTPEELAELPQHMRQPLACEGAAAEYRLQVRVNGALVAERMVHGGGLRRDRRLYVLQEFRIPSGAAAIDVRFDRSGGPQSDVSRVPAALHPESVPPHLSLERRFQLSPREVVLVTYSAQDQKLFAVEGTEDTER